MNGGGEIALEQRQKLLDAIDHLDDVRPRLALNIHDDRGSFVHPRSLPNIFHVIVDSSHIRKFDWGSVVVGDHDLLKIGSGEELVVRLNLVVLLRTVEVPDGLIEAGLLQSRAHILEVDTVRRQSGWIDAYADGGFLPATDAD